MKCCCASCGLTKLLSCTASVDILFGNSGADPHDLSSFAAIRVNTGKRRNNEADSRVTPEASRILRFDHVRALGVGRNVSDRWIPEASQPETPDLSCKIRNKGEKGVINGGLHILTP